MSSRLFPFLSLLLAAGIFLAYVNPTWSGPIVATKTAINNDNQALAAAAQYKTRESQLAAARDAIDPNNLARLEAFLPDSVDNVGIILDVNALAARSGLLLSNVDVAAGPGSSPTGAPSMSTSGVPTVDAADTVGSVDLSLSAVGTYAALQAFLKGIEDSQRLLDVRDFTVTGSETGVYNYQMTIRLYWLQ